MRARFFEPLRAETERRASAEELRARLADTERRALSWQSICQWHERHLDLQAEKRVLSEAQTKLLESFQALSAQALQANNQMFLDLGGYSAGETPDGDRRTRTSLKESLTKVDTKMQELETARVSAYAHAHVAAAVSRVGDDESRQSSTNAPHTRPVG